MWKLNAVRIHKWVKEDIKSEIRKYFEMKLWTTETQDKTYKVYIGIKLKEYLKWNLQLQVPILKKKREILNISSKYLKLPP